MLWQLWTLPFSPALPSKMISRVSLVAGWLSLSIVIDKSTVRIVAIRGGKEW